MEKIKIVIAEDHQMVRKAWHYMLSEKNEYDVVAEASNGKELIDVLQKTKADIVLMDIYMPEMNGVDATGVIKNRFPWVKIIVLSMQTEVAYVKKMFSLGVSAYISKNSTKEELFNAINNVYTSDKKYMSKDISSKRGRAEDGTKHRHLSRRELEIVKMIRNGSTNKEIAVDLHISIKTVESHRTNIFKKLNIKNVAELIKYTHDNLII